MNFWGKAALSCSAISLILHVASFIMPAAVGQAGGVHLTIPLCLGAAISICAAVYAFREDVGKAPGHLPPWAGMLGLAAFFYGTANFLYRWLAARGGCTGTRRRYVRPVRPWPNRTLGHGRGILETSRLRVAAIQRFRNGVRLHCCPVSVVPAAATARGAAEPVVAADSQPE